MINREEYNEALDIIEAFHKQLFTGTPNRQIKDKALSKVEKGDFIICVNLHQSSKTCLTSGKTYEVLYVQQEGEYGHRFYINDDNGKRKKYYSKSSQFKVVVS